MPSTSHPSAASSFSSPPLSPSPIISPHLSQLRLSPSDSFTFPRVLASPPPHSHSQACQIHSQISKRGFDSELYIINNLLSVYSILGLMPDACALFDSDVVSWDIMVNGYVKIGVMDVARKVFDEMSMKDEVSWSTMIGSYACYGRWMSYGEMDDACCLFERMPTVGKSVVTWNSMVMQFARCGMLDTASRYFDEMPELLLCFWYLEGQLSIFS